MGWFSGSTKIYVSSVVYNLAGDVDLRPNFLKTSVIGAVLSDAPSISESITNSYLQGPGLRLKSFARWARTKGFNSDLGLTTGSITSGHSIDQSVLGSQIPYDTALYSDVQVQSATIGEADYTFWADRYVAANRPDQLHGGYSAYINNSTHEIFITYSDLTTDVFTPTDFDPSGTYIYATYVLVSGSSEESITPGSVTTLPSGGSFPSTSGWTLDTSINTPHTVSLNKTTTVDTTYSDSTPPTTTTTPSSDTASYSEAHLKYEMTENIPSDGGSGIYQTKSFLFLDQVGYVTVGTKTTITTATTTTGGVTKTVKTTVVEDELVITKSYHTDTQRITVKNWSNPLVFLYKKGGGNSILDAMWSASISAGSFFPFIPFRIDNNSVPTLYPLTIYPESKEATKKAISADYDEIISKINSNSSIGDIDYAYAVFGCCLNTKENACKKYIYNFFKAILSDPGQVTSTEYSSWQAAYTAAENSWNDWVVWYWNYQNGIAAASDEPTRVPFPSMPINSMSVTSNSSSVMNYNMKISWNYMYEETGTGLWKPNAKIGDVILERTDIYSHTDPIWLYDPDSGKYYASYSSGDPIDSVTITWQVSAIHWKRLTIVGLKHENLIYKGNSVLTTAKNAFEDTSESGFIIPLHEDIYKSLSIVDYTQMSTACCYLVFNCYQVVKTPWYASGWFQIIFIVAIVIISVFTFGAAAVGAMSGVLGTNAAVGAALGLAAGSLMAVIAGAIANALAAMILTILLTKAAKAALGDRLGALISSIVTIVGMVSMQISSGLKSGETLSTAFKSLTSANNLISLTSSVGNAVADYIKAGAQDIYGEIDKYQKELSGQIKSIEDQAAAQFGYDKGIIDPTMFTDSGSPQFIIESLSTFLDRTLMTGNDIAELSMSMISDFTKLTLNTDLLPST